MEIAILIISALGLGVLAYILVQLGRAKPIPLPKEWRDDA